MKGDVEHKFTYGLENEVKQQVFTDALRLVNCSNQAKKLKRNVIEELDIGADTKVQEKLN